MSSASASANPRAEHVKELESEYILQVYRRAPVVMVRGEGAHLIDTENRRYLDFISGVGVVSLGHCHPKLAAAIGEQVTTLLHTSNLFYHPLQGEVARRLAALTSLERTFLCNSGTEANEACLKFARRYWHSLGHTARTRFVAFDHAFAGRTMGSLSVTWDEHYRAPFEPLLPGVTFVDASDPAALRRAVSNETAAIIVEPIQGEGGVRPIGREMVTAIEEVCEATGTLLIADEVQTGMGRTGWPFYSRGIGLTPDLVSVGKALGSGVPVGAAVLSDRVAAQVAPGDHGSTYGGNLLACRAALVVLDALEHGGLLDHVNEVGAYMETKLHELGRRHEVIREVRGKGLMWGLDLDIDAAPVVAAARDLGLLVNGTAKTVVRMLPPLVIEPAHVDEAVAVLDRALQKARSTAQA